MKYNEQAFNSAVKYYEKALPRGINGKTIVVYFNLKNEDAFYSLAPLSRAVHEKKADFYVSITSAAKQEGMDALFRVWDTYDAMKKGVKNSKTKALAEFIETVNKKAKNRKFEGIFERPFAVLNEGKNGFEGEKSFEGKNLALDYKSGWFRKYKWKGLTKTAAIIWKKCFALKKTENAAVGFEIIPAKKDLDHPLEDYLDNFAIAMAMGSVAKKMCKKISMGTYTPKWAMTVPMNPVADLKTTLMGCEHEKEIGEPYFKKYKILSKQLNLGILKPVQVSFGIHGKGYGGEHFFGYTIGYPSPNLKTRWNSPGQMFLKPHWYMQTRDDSRMPKTRVAITGTLPIQNFIRTCDVDYDMLRRKNEKIIKIIMKSDYLFVKGKKKVNGQLTDLKVDLSCVKKGRTYIWESDSDVRHLLNKGAQKHYGIKAGRYGNCPSGEAFFTPEKIDGTAVSDVVINIDQSYVIPKNNPLVVKFKNGIYKVQSGPKIILSKMIEKRSEAKKLIKTYKKQKSLPAKIVRSYEKNFMRTGEFAINTNPKARLSRYLIETEKIAKMMHIALGSGYEPDRETLYHWDMVINCPEQKIDIYGVNGKGKKLFILKDGNFVI